MTLEIGAWEDVPVKRSFVDRDPGLLRPWIAQDGALIRLRLVGGEVRADSLRALAEVAVTFADGRIYLTSRANLQLRGLPHQEGRLAPEVVASIAGTGLFPSPTHDLVRNIMVSPMTGRVGGRADLRDVALSLDERLCADPELVALPGLFWFSLDDGTGEVAHRSLDVGLVALDSDLAQIRIGSQVWDVTLALEDAPEALLEFARRFQMVRGTGRTALWHVDELPAKGIELVDRDYPRDERTVLAVPDPLPFGTITQHDGKTALHLEVPDGSLSAERAVQVAELSPVLVVTPWRSIVAPDLAVGCCVADVGVAVGP